MEVEESKGPPPLEINKSVSGKECRICLKEPTVTCDLFRNGDSIPEKLMAVASVQVTEGDGLPEIICLPCNQLLDASYDFKLQIQRSDEKLRQLLKLKSTEGGLSSRNIVKAIIADVISSVIYSTKEEPQDNAYNSNDNLESNRFYQTFPKEQAAFSPGKENVIPYEKESSPERVFDAYEVKPEESIDTKEEISLVFNEEEEEEEESVEKSAKPEPKEEQISRRDSTLSRLDSTQDSRTIDEEEKPLIWRTGRLRCGQCIKSFRSKLALQRHSIVHKRKTKLRYVCYVCDKQYSSIAKLKSHVSICHEKEGLRQNKRVEDEKRVARTGRKSYESSKGEKRGFKFVCKVCSKRFTYQKSFVTHAKSHPEYKIETENGHSFSCPEEESGRSNEDEEENEEEEEGADEEDEEEDDGELPAENLQCTQCGKLFATKRNLKRHISTHSGLKYNCTTCGKGFSRIDKLKDHEQSKHKTEIFENSDTEDREDLDNVHNKSSDCIEGRKKDRHNRPHKCALCPKSFAQAQSLSNHMERHKRVKETQKRFLCEVCSKCFAQSGSLVAHMRTHTGVKPYVCNVCSRAFTKSTYLHLHLRTHSGEKPYICQYCSRAFARANTLARHITMHTGEAKYHCQICTKSFRRLTSLNEHTYTHTGQRPYACKICTKRYNNAGSLYAHRKKCKAQQLSSAGFMDTSAQQTDNAMPQVLIYSQRKLVEDATVGQVTPTPQYMIANVHNQKGLPANIIQPFGVDDPNVYAINSKQFKNPYYTIYPNM